MKVYEILETATDDTLGNSNTSRPRFTPKALRGPILPGGRGTEGEPHAQYISTMASDDAESNLQKTLAGPFARMERLFGSKITINDTIPRRGSSREKGTPGSMHFRGAALDLSTQGMDDMAKRRLVNAALQAGFKGFGLADTFLHVDLGRTRFWSYGNKDFAGLPVPVVGAFVKTVANGLARPSRPRTGATT